MLACFSPTFLSYPSPCEAPHACVQSFHPEHSHPCLEASLPGRVKARSTRSRLENGMRHGFPWTNVLSSASGWELSVFEYLAACIHTTRNLCDAPQQEVGGDVHRPRGLCMHGKKSGSPQTFTFSTCFSLVFKLIRSWKKAWKKAISIKI